MIQRVALIGDVHFAAGHWRNTDRISAFQQILKRELAQPVSAFVQLGDLFNGRVGDDDLETAAELVQRMADYAPTILLVGNHGRPGYSRLLRRFKSKWPITVADAPQVLHVETATGSTLHIATIPYPNKGQLVAAGVAPGDIGRAAGEALDVICLGLAEELRQCEGPKLLIGHATIAGATASTGQPLGIEHDIAVSAPMLARFGPDVAKVFGHIHEPGEIHGAHYAGSISPSDWGETTPRRYLVVEYDDATPRILSRSIDTPRLFHCEGTLTRDLFDWKCTKGPGGIADEPPRVKCRACGGDGDGVRDLIEGTLPCVPCNGSGSVVDWTGCDVRVRFRYRQAERELLGPARERIAAIFAGTRHVEIEPVVVQAREVRAPEVVSAATLPEKLQAWARLTDTAWSERIVRCAERLLATEDGDAIAAEVEARLAPLAELHDKDVRPMTTAIEV